eukprot:4079987-Prymnesium_polylepis.1
MSVPVGRSASNACNFGLADFAPEWDDSAFGSCAEGINNTLAVRGSVCFCSAAGRSAITCFSPLKSNPPGIATVAIVSLCCSASQISKRASGSVASECVSNTTNPSLSLTNSADLAPPPIAQPRCSFFSSSERSKRACDMASLREQHKNTALSLLTTLSTAGTELLLPQ